MAQVTKRKTPNEIAERIEELFWEALFNLKNRRQLELFFIDLLSPTERTMLSKRISIAFMILKGFDYSVICEVLKVSKPTVWSVKKTIRYGGEGYKKTLASIITKEKYQKLWQDIDFYLEKIMPQGKGTDWKEKKRNLYKKHEKQLKPF